MKDEKKGYFVEVKGMGVKEEMVNMAEENWGRQGSGRGGGGEDDVEKLVRLWLCVAWQQGKIYPVCTKTACSEEEEKEEDEEKKEEEENEKRRKKIEVEVEEEEVEEESLTSPDCQRGPGRWSSSSCRR